MKARFVIDIIYAAAGLLFVLATTCAPCMLDAYTAAVTQMLFNDFAIVSTGIGAYMIYNGVRNAISDWHLMKNAN